jgi:protein-S-isoprenylcysteine O-methyltransferase Ste14
MRLLIPPPIQGLIFGVAMWQLARLLPQFAMSFPGDRYVAGAFIIVGLLIDLTAVLAFFAAKTTISPLKPQNTNSLVISGLYKISRNPMYLGMLMILTGWTIWLGNPLNAVLLAGFIAYITYAQIRPEETALHEKFGADYDDYCRRVRRWI